MMDGSMMGGMVPHGDCGPDHHGMPVNGPMCDEYGRGRNVSIEIQFEVFFLLTFSIRQGRVTLVGRLNNLPAFLFQIKFLKEVKKLTDLFYIFVETFFTWVFSETKS